MSEIICIQEIREPDIPQIAEVLGAMPIFVPTFRFRGDNFKAVIGQAIFSRLPIRASEHRFYVGKQDVIPHEELPLKQANRVCTVLDTEKDDVPFRFINTHFTWTPDGEPSDMQRVDARSLFATLERSGEFVLCGDFNAPRGGEIFAELASRYKDNIPSHYKTSLDLTLHRAAKERLHEIENKMVDGLFTTPAYTATDVELIDGVSDHCAVVATIHRN